MVIEDDLLRWLKPVNDNAEGVIQVEVCQWFLFLMECKLNTDEWAEDGDNK